MVYLESNDKGNVLRERGRENGSIGNSRRVKVSHARPEIKISGIQEFRARRVAECAANKQQGEEERFTRVEGRRKE